MQYTLILITLSEWLNLPTALEILFFLHFNLNSHLHLKQTQVDNLPKKS